MKKGKRKKRKSKKFVTFNKILTLFILSLSFTALILATILIISSFNERKNKEIKKEKLQKRQTSQKLLKSRLEKVLNNTLYAPTTKIIKKDQTEDLKHHMKKIENLPKKLKNLSKKIITTIHKHTIKRARLKPKLALIIDDVSSAKEVQRVKELGLKVNFSFFPVNINHPLTAKLASVEPFYMVHLPLEAIKFSAEEIKTLYVNDSLKTIKKRLSSIKKDFPRLRFINNHTGSKFTANSAAVKRLYKAARFYGLDIIDSRTTSLTKLPAIYKSFNRKLLSRDIFLDNKPDVIYICNQIQLAVNQAIKKGTAIAIGHPRKNTVKALKKCKSYLDPVDLVYIPNLYSP